MIVSGVFRRSLSHLALLAAGGLVLIAAGQPLLADDLWWHLALGREYSQAGPWIEQDPLLFTSEGPPRPSSWLAEVGLHQLHLRIGFSGLRIVHVAILLGLLTLVWSLFRRASGSAAAASCATLLFATTSAYRLVQLRPHLLSIAAVLLLYRLLIEPERGPSSFRVALAFGVSIVWANVHAGFPLAPAILVTALAGTAVAGWLSGRGLQAVVSQRSQRLAVALGVVLLGTLANPEGIQGYLAHLSSSPDSVQLHWVIDEWLGMLPLRLPAARLPPSWLTWASVWGLSIGVVACALYGAREWRGKAAPASPVDPALLALSVLALVAIMSAVRFTWLLVFPMLLVLRASRGIAPARLAAGSSAVATAVALAFPVYGDWPMVSRIMPRSRGPYMQAYPTAKYYGNAAWFIRDTNIEGRLFAPYATSGFLGYWLSPGVRTFVNGTLNVPSAVMEAYAAVQSGDPAGTESLVALLDRHEVDLFLGVGIPESSEAGRSVQYTTALLERTPGWIPIFRNMRSAIYLRMGERNADNLSRVARYYEERGIPFDVEVGVDPQVVIRSAPNWARLNCVAPVDFAEMLGSARASVSRTSDRLVSLDGLASVYSVLGLYEKALGIDERILRSNPDHLRALRRHVWSNLRLNRMEDALNSAASLQERSTGLLSRAIARVAEQGDASGDERVPRLRVFSRAQGRSILAQCVAPEVRPPRDGSASP